MSDIKKIVVTGEAHLEKLLIQYGITQNPLIHGSNAKLLKELADRSSHSEVWEFSELSDTTGEVFDNKVISNLEWPNITFVDGTTGVYRYLSTDRVEGKTVALLCVY